jgi:hypothetical protein
MRKFQIQMVCSFVIVAALLSGLCAAVYSEANVPNTSDGDIFWIRGGPVDVLNPRYVEVEQALQATVAELGLNTRMTFRHNIADGELCSLIVRERRDQGRSDKLILIGHSWGAAHVVELSKCLARHQIQVDLLVLMDAIQRPLEDFPSVVPANVVRVCNWYQRQDPILRGVDPVVRQDGSAMQIVPRLIRLRAPGVGLSVFDAHNKMVSTVVELGLLQSTVAEELSR